MGSGKSALGIVRKYHSDVMRVSDARKPITIAVTREDQRASRKRSPDGCALAKACERRFDGAIIWLSTAYLVKGDKAYRYRVPESIQREIVSFDRHHDFAPGEYTLKVFTSTGRLGPRQYKQPKNRPSERTDKTRTHRTAGIRAL